MRSSHCRRCSAGEGTIHSGHSMNWIRDVKGASYLDFKYRVERKQAEEVRICVRAIVRTHVRTYSTCANAGQTPHKHLARARCTGSLGAQP